MSATCLVCVDPWDITKVDIHCPSCVWRLMAVTFGYAFPNAGWEACRDFCVAHLDAVAAEHEGKFGMNSVLNPMAGWRASRESLSGLWSGASFRVPRNANTKCRECGGGHEDYKYTCAACGATWWVDGVDS